MTGSIRPARFVKGDGFSFTSSCERRHNSFFSFRVRVFFRPACLAIEFVFLSQAFGVEAVFAGVLVTGLAAAFFLGLAFSHTHVSYL